MNYYLSIGLACFGLAILWRARRFEWIAAAPFAALALLAHPIVFFGWSARPRTSELERNCWAGGSWRCPLSARARLPRFTGTRRIGRRCWQIGIAVRFIFIMARPVGALRERYAAIAAAAFFLGIIFVALDFLPAQTGGFFLETIRIAVRIVLGDVLRDSAAP